MVADDITSRTELPSNFWIEKPDGKARVRPTPWILQLEAAFALNAELMSMLAPSGPALE
jgi:hypothetical protein